jgi:Uma2 family endonuclease
MLELKPGRVDISEYLKIERSNDQRFEFHEGEVFAMAGGTLNHSTICNNTAGELRNAVRKGGSCVAFNSEMKIEIYPKGKYIYPDAGVACPELKESNHLVGAITNPRLIVEVTSEASGNYDRGNKLKYYFSIPSLQEYLLIEQDEPSVTVFRRRGDLMKMDSYSGVEAIIPLESIDGNLALKDIYENVKFSPTKEK